MSRNTNCVGTYVHFFILIPFNVLFTNSSSKAGFLETNTEPSLDKTRRLMGQYFFMISYNLYHNKTFVPGIP